MNEPLHVLHRSPREVVEVDAGHTMCRTFNTRVWCSHPESCMGLSLGNKSSLRVGKDCGFD